MDEVEELTPAQRRLRDKYLPEGTEHFGNWWSINCPYCNEEITEVYDYGLTLEHEEGDYGDSMQCPTCEQDFIVRFMCERDELAATQMEDGYQNARQRFCEARDDMVERWQSMHLNVVMRNDEVFICYLCERPDSRIQSCMLIFSREGITILGDWVPLRGGCTSNHGYGEWWFSGQLSEGYLCEKFGDVKELSSDHALLVAIQKAFAARMRENREEAVDYVPED